MVKTVRGYTCVFRFIKASGTFVENKRELWHFSLLKDIFVEYALVCNQYIGMTTGVPETLLNFTMDSVHNLMLCVERGKI